MITPNGTQDWLSNEVYPDDTGEWDDLTTWDSFTDWFINPTLPLRWLTVPQQFASTQDFNLTIETTAIGQVSYEVYTSNTGLFGGEETTTIIDSGDTDVPGFSGQWYRVGIIVNKLSVAPKLQDVQITSSNRPISEIQTNVDTSALNGTGNARQIQLARNYSVISEITINVQEVPAYNLDVYVTDHLSCKTVIPRVVSKDRSTPTIALIGLDNVAREGIVDISIKGLPEQYMSGNNLLVK